AARGAASGGATSRGAEPARAEPTGAEPAGAEPGVVEPGESEGAEPRGTTSSGGPAGASPRLSPRPESPPPQQLREWFAQCTRLRSGAARAGGSAAGGTGAGGAGATSLGGAGVPAGAGGTTGVGAASPGGARTRGTGPAGAGGVGGARAEGAGAGDPGVGGTGAGGTSAGDAGAGGARAGDPSVGGAGAVDLGARGAGLGGVASGSTGAVGTVQRRPFFVPPPPSSLPPPDSVLRQRCEPESRRALPVWAVRTGHRVPRPRPPLVPDTHIMALCPSSIPLWVPLPSSPTSSLFDVPDPESDLARAASPTVPRLLATVVTHPLFESSAASPLIAELVDFVAACRLDYATSLAAESESDCPPSVGGECALGTDVLEDKQEDFECLTTAVPHLVAMLLAPEGDPDAPDIPTPRSYAEAITVPSSGANIVDGMWIFRGSLHEEIWLRRPPGFTWSFPAGTQWTLRRPVYGLRQAPREWHDTLRTTPTPLGFAPSTADPSLFLRTDTSLSPFYVLVYVNDFVFATADTEALALVKSELQKRHTCTGLGELRNYLGLQITQDRARRTITLTQSPDESVEPSGPYPELVGCLMYLMTCTRPDLAYPLSILARYVAPGRHRPEHSEAAKRMLRYLCCTLGMGLVLGLRGPVVLTGHADASWVDDLATQRSSQGYTSSLGSGSVSWWSTRSSSVLSSSCEVEIYARAMAAQELCWLTYLLTDLGERSSSFPQRGQLRLAYVATWANTSDIFTKALQSGDHQRLCTVLGRVVCLT
ncbi:unnamed protein product, partial [Closterium sp. NIES-53]